MISLRKPTGEKTPISIYQLRIALYWVQPAVWRRLTVPGTANLGWLHAVIQVAMGWTNSHQHKFTHGEKIYSDLFFEMNEAVDGPRVEDENKIVLQKILLCENDVLSYEYDFGDSWFHQIEVEKILPAESTPALMAKCLDGANACPPEDCGGPPGYDNLLRILKNSKHKEYKFMKVWIGRPFDPKIFDLDKTNKYLTQLKWPRATESQLRRILMSRDGASE